jgi:hypothetical protein
MHPQQCSVNDAAAERSPVASCELGRMLARQALANYMCITIILPPNYPHCCIKCRKRSPVASCEVGHI